MLTLITSVLFFNKNSARIPSSMHSSTALVTASSKETSCFAAYFLTLATYCAYSFNVLQCSIKSELWPSFTFSIVTRMQKIIGTHYDLLLLLFHYKILKILALVSFVSQLNIMISEPLIVDTHPQYKTNF